MLKKMKNIIESKNDEDLFETNSKNDNQKMNKKYILKYDKNYAKIKKSYFIELVEVFDFASIIFEYKNNKGDLKSDIFRKFTFFKRIINYLSLKIVENKFFKSLILFFVLVDTLMLISSYSYTLSAQTLFGLIYFFELLCKINVIGVQSSENSFFSNKWNIFDCVTIILIFIYRVGYILSLYNLDLFKNLIILRLVNIPAFQVILEKLIFSLNLLVETLFIIFFSMISIAMLGVRLFHDNLKNKCMDSISGIFTNDLCGNINCQKNLICIKSLQNPDNGVSSFDEIGFGIMNVVRIVTLDGWTDVLKMLHRTTSNFVFIFFIVTIVFGNFFLFNIMLAVLKVKFSQCNSSVVKEMKNSLEMYQEKIYDLKLLKEKGIYEKNKITGKIAIRRSTLKTHGNQLGFNVKSGISKVKNSIYNLFLKNPLESKNQEEFSLRGTFKIRIKKNEIYEPCSINDVIENRYIF